VTVFFGGYSGCTPSECYVHHDTWEWDGATWTQRTDIGPPDRFGHALAYDATRGVTVLSGGIPNSEVPPNRWYSDTWEWDGTQWAQRMVAGRSPRGGQAVYDALRGVVVLLGGALGEIAGTWEWDGTNWMERMVVGPGSRRGPAMAYDSARHVMV